MTLPSTPVDILGPLVDHVLGGRHRGQLRSRGALADANLSLNAGTWSVCVCHGKQELRPNMTIIMVMPETLPLAEIKAHLSEIVDRVEREHERVILTRNGRPAAVILSPGDLEALEDTLELLSDPQALTEIEAARDDLAHGRVFTAEDLRSKYLHR